MKKVYKFSKFFVPAVILSVLLIAGGICSVLTKGFNKGLDFAPGQSIEVQIDNNSISFEDVAKTLEPLGKKIEVKAVTNEGKVSYQIRTALTEEAPVEENDAKAAESKEVNKDAKIMDKDEQEILGALNSAYGADKVTEIQKTTITAQYSSTLIRNSIYLVLATLVLIFVYAAIRFKWDFALASVLAIIHDALIMISFISVSGLEFTTTTIAAILTIIGYSINATVVILDRIRSDINGLEARSIKDVLNSALSATLSRSLITTITTLFAVLSLVYFTTGDIHNFAVALVVGLLSGCYSSIFIAGAFISLTRKNWKPVASVNANVVKFESN